MQFPKLKFQIFIEKLIEHYKMSTGIPRFTLLMWGHIKNPQKQKPYKSRLLSGPKGEENKIEL